MGIPHVIVDGSNIATEGRTAPSLSQLDEAVVSFLEEYGHPALTVVVDATFGHRIDESEREAFEAGIVNGELVTPPAGAIGRGDAFVLQIAAKTDATIFSNDSFQEFHGTYEWLFDEGRLIGGKPVPNVGWVFVPRTPVRGPTSRRATRESRGSSSGSGSGSGSGSRSKRSKAVVGSAEASGPMPVPKSPPPGRGSRTRGKASASVSAAAQAGDAAVEVDEITNPSAEGGEKKSSRSRKRRSSSSSSSSKPANMINEPMAFLAFVSAHPVGSLVEAVVDRFSSHGAYAVADDAQCYIPLKAMADPAPTKAREVLTVGEPMTFVVTSFDTPRRGIDVAIPGVAPVSDAPPAPDLGGGTAAAESNQPAEEAPSMAVTKKAAAKKAPAKKAPAAKKTAAKKAPAKKAAAATKAVAKKAPAKKAVAKKTVARKAPAKKAPAKTAVAKKAPAKKAPAAKKTAAKKAPAKKAPAKKAVTAKKTVAKKAPAKKAPVAKKTAAKKAPAKKAVAKRAR